MSDGALFTKTHFGRHAETYEALEGILRDKKITRCRALMVGPGITVPLIFKHELNVAYPGFRPFLNSYDPFEAAFALQRADADYSLEVADVSELVRDVIAGQKTMLIDDYELQDRSAATIVRAGNNYWRPRRHSVETYLEKTAGCMEHPSEMDETQLDAFRRHLSEVTGNYVSLTPFNVACSGVLPVDARKRTNVLSGDIIVPENWAGLQEKFDLVICNYVLYYVEKQFPDTVKILTALTKPGGLLMISDNTLTFRKIARIKLGDDWNPSGDDWDGENFNCASSGMPMRKLYNLQVEDEGFFRRTQQRSFIWQKG